MPSYRPRDQDVPGPAETQAVTDRTSLLTAALAAPWDDTPRLAFADWLQERDDPAEYALGQFIRAGVTAARFRDQDVIDDPAFYRALVDLSAVSTTGHPARWVAALGLGPTPLSDRDWGWDNVADRVTVRVGAAAAVVERGMIAGLTVTLGEWSDAAPRALAAWPVERVAVADRPGFGYRVEPPKTATGMWRLVSVLRVPARRVRIGGGPIVPALAPGPFLVESADEWNAAHEYPTRAALVADIVPASCRLADELIEVAGDRWPGRLPGR
jgi:uncharacterized protein (TIGR02996 family)